MRNKGFIILAVMVGGIALFCWGLPLLTSNMGLPPAFSPVITLPGEPLDPAHPLLNFMGQDVFITNTLIATWITYAILLIVAIIARMGMSEIPSGFYNTVETIVEMLYNISVETIGHKFARPIFPVAATIFLVIMVANISKLVPGFESVGVIHHAHEGAQGYATKEVANGVYMLVEEEGDTAHAEGDAPAAEEGGEEVCTSGCVVTPFLRGAATDINFPLGLAIVTFLTVQVFGVMGLGGHYIEKFINVSALGRGGMGFMDFGVGLFELVLEPFKMVSLTFRLLGNIFGGAVLVIVVSILVPYLMPTGLYVYEIFVGVIQAYVFFMLTLVYAAMAMVGHGGDDHH